VHAISKYLRTFAEPEVTLERAVSSVYERCLVVPACRESAAMLQGYAPAAASSPGRTLCIVVVNGRIDAIREHHAANASFLRALLDRAPLRIADAPRAYLGNINDALDVLVVDRASEGLRFQVKYGVGLARKIGMDLALALHVAGKSRLPFILWNDS
jgi:hypothetical protein